MLRVTVRISDQIFFLLSWIIKLTHKLMILLPKSHLALFLQGFLEYCVRNGWSIMKTLRWTGAPTLCESEGQVNSLSVLSRLEPGRAISVPEFICGLGWLATYLQAVPWTEMNCWPRLRWALEAAYSSSEHSGGAGHALVERSLCRETKSKPWLLQLLGLRGALGKEPWCKQTPA